MGRYALALVIAIRVFGQNPVSIEHHARIAAGTRTVRIGFTVKANPEPGDRFVADVSTDSIRTALVTPDGRRVNENGADQMGMSWSTSPMTPQSGSTDGGHTVMVGFEKSGPAGQYYLEFDASDTKTVSDINARFISERASSDSLLRSIPAVKMLGPVRVKPAASAVAVPFTLDRPEKAALLDVVVTDPAASITLVLPGGAALASAEGKNAGVEWKTLRSEGDLSGNFAGLGGFLLKIDGTHRVFFFESAGAGRYEIRARTATKDGAKLTAAFVPIGNIMQQATQEIQKLGDAPPGEVRLLVPALPYDCFVGDPLDLNFGLTGDPVAEPVNVQVQLEYRMAQGQDSSGRAQWSDPVVENANVAATPTGDRRYTARIFPSKAGLLRVSLEVSGKRVGGKPFSDRETSMAINVHRVAAHFQSLTEKAIPKAGNGKLERLDITANLDVVLPGRYDMRLEVANSGAGGIGMLADGTASLGTGMQSLTVSVPAAEIRKRLKDGPWTIRNVQIFRPEGNSFGDGVGTGPLSVETAPYQRDQWDRGETWSDEEATAQGIFPADSGRFRLVEIQWGVTTPGGNCNWSGSLGGGNSSMHFLSYGRLEKGRTVLSFVFDGASVARAAEAKWYFSPILNCDSGREADDHAQPLIYVTLDPKLFEPSASFLVEPQEMPLAAGASRNVLIPVHGKKNQETVARIQEIPGISINAVPFAVPGEAYYGVDVKVALGTKPGRYFVPVEATSGGEIFETAIVVDVIP